MYINVCKTPDFLGERILAEVIARIVHPFQSPNLRAKKGRKLKKRCFSSTFAIKSSFFLLSLLSGFDFQATISGALTIAGSAGRRSIGKATCLILRKYKKQLSIMDKDSRKKTLYNNDNKQKKLGF